MVLNCMHIISSGLSDVLSNHLLCNGCFRNRAVFRNYRADTWCIAPWHKPTCAGGNHISTARGYTGKRF